MKDLFDQLLSKLRDPQWVGAAIFAMALGAWREMKKRKDPTPSFQRKVQEIDAMEERETEVVVAAEEFSKGVEIDRLRKLTIELSLENRQLRTELEALKEGKLDLEAREAESRVAARTAQRNLEHITGRQKLISPRSNEPRATTAGDIITERPRPPPLRPKA
jgi:type VI protein secretion system component VasA